jgi:hypothetical protein
MKGKNIFIKCNIMRYLDTSSGHIGTLDPLMKMTIMQKYTPFRAISEREFVASMNIGPTRTPKDVN